MSRRRAAILASIALLMSAGVFVWLLRVDERVARWVFESGWQGYFRSRDYAIGLRRANWMKMPGEWPYQLVLMGFVIALDKRRGRGGWLPALFLLACSCSSALNAPLKWIIGRERPWIEQKLVLKAYDFHPFYKGIKGLFDSGDLSMPSGHAWQAFGFAAGLAILYPRWGWIAFLGAISVAIQRVTDNSHYCSDVLLAAVLGVASAFVIHCSFRRHLGRDIVLPPAAASPSLSQTST